jgi:hypothetical protein
MKNIALLVVIALTMTSCTIGTEIKPEQTIKARYGSKDIEIKVVKVRGHEYVIMDGAHQGGICHAESCSCK